MADTVRYELRSGVAWVTIDRAEAHNALNRSVREGLFEAAKRFNQDDSAMVLVLTGAGDVSFCAGGDLKEMQATGLRVPAPDYMPIFGQNIEVVKPTIAAVNGNAYGGGFLLAQMCDLCVAVEHATFAVSEVQLGRGTPWAVPLSWLIPPKVALQLLLTGDPISAKRAHEVGLVNEVVDGPELQMGVQELAIRIAQNAPLSVRAAKRTAYLLTEEPIQRSVKFAQGFWRSVYESRDALEGPDAFAAGRPPKWEGR